MADEEKSEGMQRLYAVSQVIFRFTEDITEPELKLHVLEQAWSLAARAVREGKDPVKVLRGLQSE